MNRSSREKPERDLIDKRGDYAEARVPGMLDRQSANGHYREAEGLVAGKKSEQPK